MNKVLMFFIGVLFLSACQSQGVSELRITATDIAYDVDTLEVQAGQPVKLVYVNEGVLEHDFVIEKMNLTIMMSDSSHDSEHVGHDMSDTKAALHLSVKSGETGYIEFTALEPGEYTFYCSVVGHKEAGMIGKLIVH